VNSNDAILIIILTILVAISAVCSATETAISSINVIRVKSLAKKGNKRAKRLYKLTNRYSEALSTILIFNNIVNTASASIMTYLISSKVGASGVVYATILMTIIILIFGEITPKIIGKEYSLKLSLRMAPILLFFIFILKPINFLVIKMESLIKGKKKKITATEEELLEIVQTIEFEGVLEQDESELIQNAALFDDKRVKDIMVYKEDVVFLYDDASVDTIKNLIIKEKYSRIPVLNRSTNKVIGIIHEGDLIDNFLEGKSISIKTLLKDAIYLTKNRRLSFALEKIQKTRMHMAIVIDNNEDHNFLGIVTLEDILEELVGEIYDEYDDLPKNVLKIGLHTFQIDPNISVSDFFEEYLENVKMPNIKSKTFVGWLNELNINLKKRKEFTYENIKIKILEVNDNVPLKLEITVLSKYNEVIS